MEDKDFIPIEKLNTRVEVYEEPSNKEKLSFFKQKVVDKARNLKGRFDDGAPRRKEIVSKIERFGGLFKSQKSSGGLVKGFGNTSRRDKIVNRLDNRSRRGMSFQDNNVFTRSSSDVEKVYRSSSSDSNSIYHMGSNNNPYNFINKKRKK